MNNERDVLTKEEHMVNFVKSFVAIEDAMEPFKEQRKDLRESYNSNNWLSRQEMRLAVKAYRLMKQDTDIEELTGFVDHLKKTVGRSFNV